MAKSFCQLTHSHLPAEQTSLRNPNHLILSARILFLHLPPLVLGLMTYTAMFPRDFQGLVCPKIRICYVKTDIDPGSMISNIWHSY